MGIFKRNSSSSYDKKPSSSSYDRGYVARSNNPDPKNYKIIKAEEVKGVLILWLKYPDCSNYEGNKVLVFARGITLIDLVNQKSIDPHFSNNTNFISPVARFEPTERGWNWAVSLANTSM